MAQFLRPDSTITTNTWSGNINGADLHLDIGAEAASDTEFIANGTNSSDLSEVIVGSFVEDPANRLNHIVRYRYSKSAAGGNARNITVGVYNGATLIAEQTHTGISEVWTAGTFTLSEAEANNITDYTDLRLRFTAAGTTGSQPANRRSVQVSWAEMEIPDAPPPPPLLTNLWISDHTIWI